MFPFDKLTLILNWLRGNGPAPSRNVLIHAVTAIVNWAADMLFPEKPTTAALPAWLTGPLAMEVLNILFALLKRFLSPGTATVTAEENSAMADKLEAWSKELPK